MKTKNPRLNSPHDRIIKVFIDNFKNRNFGISPVVSRAWVGKLLMDLLKDHSEKGLICVIDLYFEHETPEVYHLPTILSAYYINKYLPKAKIDPNLFANAEEYNKEIW